MGDVSPFRFIWRYAVGIESIHLYSMSAFKQIGLNTILFAEVVGVCWAVSLGRLLASSFSRVLTRWIIFGCFSACFPFLALLRSVQLRSPPCFWQSSSHLDTWHMTLFFVSSWSPQPALTPYLFFDLVWHWGPLGKSAPVLRLASPWHLRLPAECVLLRHPGGQLDLATCFFARNGNKGVCVIRVALVVLLVVNLTSAANLATTTGHYRLQPSTGNPAKMDISSHQWRKPCRAVWA